MSVRCKDCGAIAGYGHEIGHKSGCPALERAARIGRMYNKVSAGDDSNCTTGPVDGCEYPNGCLRDDGSGFCPLCDEMGADRIAEYYSDKE